MCWSFRRKPPTRLLKLRRLRKLPLKLRKLRKLLSMLLRPKQVNELTRYTSCSYELLVLTANGANGSAICFAVCSVCLLFIRATHE